MKWNGPRKRIELMVAACLWGLILSTVSALPPQSSTDILKAVPVARTVMVDGRLDEWDTSGGMLVYPARELRDRFSVRVYAMWDREALYLALQWRDPTPMVNNVDPDGAPGEGWMADSFQARFTTDRQIHLMAWYGSRKNTSVAQLCYDAALNPEGMLLARERGPKLNDRSGFQLAFLKDSDGRGYVQEIRVPWTLLYKQPAPSAGMKLRFTGEYYWGGPSATTWPAVQWSDPINPANPSRVVIYQNPDVWGQLELLGQGNLPPVQPESDAPLMQGPVPIRVEVPAEATRFTLAIDDAQGRRVRNLVAHAKVSDYAVRQKDGKRIVEVPWDGRTDGLWDKERTLFLGDLVAPGAYTVRGLFHSGIGVAHAGSFYNPGTPPWATANGSGGWGFDHSNPTAVGAMPRQSTAKGRVFLGWPIGECGVGFIGLDAAGRKFWEWLRRGAGAHLIAANETHVYFCFLGDNGIPCVGRVKPDSGEQVPFGSQGMDLKLPGMFAGLAVHHSELAVSVRDANKILLFDAESGTIRQERTVAAPGNLVFMPDGALVGISSNRLFRLAPGVSAAEFFPAKGCRLPLALAADSKGRLYVSDGCDLNIKVLSSAGAESRELREIGCRGGHKPGPWDRKAIGNPVALAVEERADGRVQIWVVESSLSPRRVSVWTDGGTFLTDYVGNSRYSGSGGLMSDDIPDMGIDDGVIFKVDYARQSYQPVEIMGGQPDALAGKTNVFALGMNQKGASFGNGYHFLSNVSGREQAYYCEAADAVPRLYMKQKDRWMCVAALGPAGLVPEGFPSKAPHAKSVFLWSDLNRDGFQSADEVQWVDVGREHVLNGGWGFRCDRNLAFYHSGWAFKPVRFTRDGAPIYAPDGVRKLPGELGELSGDIYRTRHGYAGFKRWPGDAGDIDKHGVVFGLGMIAGYDGAGHQIWGYPNYWIAVHGALSAPMAMPGVIMGLLEVSGVVDMDSYSYVSLRGNMGQEFLIRDDGLYMAELFTDQRMAPAAMPETPIPAGFPINDMTMGGEPFNGWTARQRDGRVRMTYGVTDVRIAEVTGLGTLRDMPAQTLVLDEALLARCRQFVPAKAAPPEKTDIEVGLGAAIPPEDGLFDQPEALVIRSGREEVGRALLRYDEKNLYAAWRVFDPTPFVNKGIHAPLLFKTGDSVNLFVAEGDNLSAGELKGTRVLLANLGDTPAAVVYRPAGPGDQPYVFESPVRKTPFRYVKTDPGISFDVRRTPTGYLVTATIPWSVLAIEPKAGRKLKLDVGLLFGDDTGRATARRVQWADKETNVINDVPTESEFFPSRWGTMTLR